MRRYHVTVAASLTAFLLTAAPAAAVIIDLTASMDCAQADAGAGTCGMGGSGTGSATITFDTDTNLLSWNITWNGLSSPALLMHFHGPAFANQNAGVQVDTGVVGPPVIGAAALNNQQATDLLNQLWYLNIHTNAFLGGEIRGQVLVQAPSACAPSPELVCTSAAQAKLDYNEAKAGKEKVNAQWKKLADPTAQGDFGDPVVGSTLAAVCIYDDGDALVEQLIVDRAGAQCAGKDCWKATGTKGYAYKDKENSADGVSKLGYKAGDAGKGKVSAKGKNNSAKGQSSLPIGVFASLTGNNAPTIQMVTSDGFCVGATMAVKKDQDGRYTAELK